MDQLVEVVERDTPYPQVMWRQLICQLGKSPALRLGFEPQVVKMALAGE